MTITVNLSTPSRNSPPTVSGRPLLGRAVALVAATGLAAGLAACGSGGDGDGGDGTTIAVDFSDFTTTARSAGYTCIGLGDAEEPTTGLTGGLTCMPAADKAGTDPMFILFRTSDVASGKDVARKAVEKTGAPGGTGAGLDEAVLRNMFPAVDGDGLAGFCFDRDDNCARVLPGMKLTVDKLDGAMGIDESIQRQLGEARRKNDDEQRAADKARAKATGKTAVKALKYTGWNDIDAAVGQMDAWGIRCMTPDNEVGMWGTTCGPDDDALFFGDRADFRRMSKDKGATDEQLDQVVRVSDGDWTLMCRPGGRGTCDTVADRTGKKVETGL